MLSQFYTLLDSFLFGFGVSFDASAGLYTSGEGLSVGLIPFMKVAGSLGYGHGFDINDNLRIEVGGVAHTSAFFYSIPIGIEELVGLFSSSGGSIGLKFTNFTFSMDLGTTLRLQNGLSLGFLLFTGIIIKANGTLSTLLILNIV